MFKYFLKKRLIVSLFMSVLIMLSTGVGEIFAYFNPHNKLYIVSGMAFIGYLVFLYVLYAIYDFVKYNNMTFVRLASKSDAKFLTLNWFTSFVGLGVTFCFLLLALFILAKPTYTDAYTFLAILTMIMNVTLVTLIVFMIIQLAWHLSQLFLKKMRLLKGGFWLIVVQFINALILFKLVEWFDHLSYFLNSYVQLPILALVTTAVAYFVFIKYSEPIK
ncbi:MAG: hypothetical protein Q3960_04835 [Lactobacillus sp.]|nr:hypothetical protein [Lactobacillus sp.]